MSRSMDLRESVVRQQEAMGHIVRTGQQANYLARAVDPLRSRGFCPGEIERGNGLCAERRRECRHRKEGCYYCSTQHELLLWITSRGRWQSLCPTARGCFECSATALPSTLPDEKYRLLCRALDRVAAAFFEPLLRTPRTRIPSMLPWLFRQAVMKDVVRVGKLACQHQPSLVVAIRRENHVGRANGPWVAT